MKTSIKVGNAETIQFVVTEEMQPQFHGVVIHPVCSTWDIAHQFECAARETLAPHLEIDEQGIGSHLSIDHSAPAPLGTTVTVSAIITELKDCTVVCEITASIGDTVCATGKQIQRVLPSATIKNLIQNAAST
jgi:fluoroacetyl-CoA thioesterase